MINVGNRAETTLSAAIGTEIRAERNRRNITLMQLGTMTDPEFYWKRIQNYEVGHRSLTVDTLSIICQALGVDMLVIIERARQNARQAQAQGNSS
jgi:transcriptional regulator with XRE-family HTH domain